MDTQRWELAGSIFERLLGTPQEQRNTMLDSLCGDDAELKQVVASMLDSESSALHFEEGLGVKRDAADSTTDADASPPTEPVGPWRLVKKIGSGGMGVVWLAERADGQFEQRAALKLIKRGMDSEAVLKRFLRERQILARLTHAHIAHLLDGGIAADGRPYFAMEYVEGLPLLRYCHERGVTLEQRIRLFVDVCAAVQFAHTHHVVHRDLKPSNILVTDEGGVKLLDFGIAKLLEGDAAGTDTITHLQRERPMTPAYAAPEQISGGKISEATDIYALGCVLYELLTGQRVRDFSAAADVKDVLRIIESTDPVAPSRLKLATPPVPPKRLRGDLDTIVLTALKRVPRHRYPSAAAFATDLKKYLGGNPITARRDSVFYRGYKFARRHRSGLAALATVAVIAVAVLIIELRERLPAAPVAPGSSLAVVDFNNLSQQPANAWLATALAEMLSTRLVVGSALHAVPDELVRPARADLAAPLAGGYAPQSLAVLRKRLGADYVLSGSYLVSGVVGDAKLHLDVAMQDARSGAAIATVEQNGDLSDLPSLIAKLGSSLREKSGLTPITAIEERQVDKAQPPNIEVARHMGQALNALHKGDPVRAKEELLQAQALAPSYAPAYVLLAEAWRKMGYDSKALAAAEQAAAHSEGLPQQQQLMIARELAVQKTEWDKAIELDKNLLALDPKNPEMHLAFVDNLLAANKPDDAAAALAELRKLPGSGGDPRIELSEVAIADNRSDYKAQLQHAELALKLAVARDESILATNAKYDLARAYYSLGEKDAAEKHIRQAIGEYQRSGNPYYEADARFVLASIQSSQSRQQEARDEYQRILAIYQRIDYRPGIALMQWNLADVLRMQGDRDAMRTAADRALEMSREIGDIRTQVWSENTIAQLNMDEGAGDEIIESFRRILALSEREGVRDQHIDVLVNYAEALRLRGQLDVAEKVCLTTQAEAHHLDSPFHTMRVEYECAAIALGRGDVDGAASAFRRAQSIAERLGNDEVRADVALELALIDVGRGQAESACALLRQAAQGYGKIDMVTGAANAQGALALCYADVQRAAERDRALGQARELRSRTTFRGQVFMADLALIELKGPPSQAAASLIEFADDADRRSWVLPALEARLAALRLLEQGDDATRALALRKRISSEARARGFGWVLARATGTSRSVH